MAEDIEDIAKLLGAKIVGEVPDVGGGAFGAARLARIYQQRMHQIRESAPGRSASDDKGDLMELGLSARTIQSLAEMSYLLGTAEQSASPVKSAAALLENVGSLILEEIKGSLNDADAAEDVERIAERTGRKVMRRILGTASHGRQATA